MSGLLTAYSAFLRRYPTGGNMLQSAVLFATGDVIAQQMIEKKGLKNHDYKRTARIVIWGGGIFAPAVGAWFRVLEKIPIQNKLGVTVARVALDQLVAAPVVLSTFFTVMTYMEGGNFQDAKAKWREQFFPTLKANWWLFVPFQAINQLIPLQYRLLAINAVNIPWNAFLSLQNAKGRTAEKHSIELAKMV